MPESKGRKFTASDIRRLGPNHKQLIDETAIKEAKSKKYIVHGSKALMKHLPPELRRKTDDWDFFANKPRQAMDISEDILDKKVGCDAFYESRIPSGKAGMVYRVMSRITNKAVFDFMITPKGNKKIYTIIGGIRWETLEHAKKMYRYILDTEFDMGRRIKTSGDLRRIIAFEKQLKKVDKSPSRSFSLERFTSPWKW